MRLSVHVQEALIDIFKSVADLCDGGDDTGELKETYARWMQDPTFREFYGRLVDERFREVHGDTVP